MSNSTPDKEVNRYRVLKSFYPLKKDDILTYDGGIATGNFYYANNKENSRMTKEYVEHPLNKEFFALITEPATPIQEEKTIVLKFIETDSKFIETVSSMISYDGNNWYYLPFWFKKVGEGMYAEYPFDKIPKGLKKLIQQSRLPETHPSIEEVKSKDNCTCKVGEPYNSLFCKIHGDIPTTQPSQKSKEVRFTTDDGTLVTAGDTIWVLSTNNWHSSPTKVPENAKPFKGVTGCEFKYFYYYAKLEQYILDNKPLLSLNDLLEVWHDKCEQVMTGRIQGYPMYKRFEQKAKQKLNQQ